MSNAACNLIWSWNFGDGAGASSNKNPSYTYQKQGTFTTTLVVSNSAGTSAPKTAVINVSP
jgi:serine protease